MQTLAEKRRILLCEPGAPLCARYRRSGPTKMPRYLIKQALNESPDRNRVRTILGEKTDRLYRT
jgi:phosphoribosyl-dephospho-CoA transferase